jgi:hypothetical protein
MPKRKTSRKTSRKKSKSKELIVRNLAELEYEYLTTVVRREVAKLMGEVGDDNEKRKCYANLIMLLTENRTPDGELLSVTRETPIERFETDDNIIGFKLSREGKISWGKVNDKGQLEHEITKRPDPVLICLLELTKLQSK